jgi:hypothetical protein
VPNGEIGIKPLQTKGKIVDLAIASKPQNCAIRGTMAQLGGANFGSVGAIPFRLGCKTNSIHRGSKGFVNGSASARACQLPSESSLGFAPDFVLQ